MHIHKQISRFHNSLERIICTAWSDPFTSVWQVTLTSGMLDRIKLEINVDGVPSTIFTNTMVTLLKCLGRFTASEKDKRVGF